MEHNDYLTSSTESFPLFDNPTPQQSIDQGKEAAKEATPPVAQIRDDQQAVLDIIQAAGSWGSTSTEIGAILGKPKNEFSGRITELVKFSLVFRKQGVRRGKDSVLFARGFA